MKNKFPVTEIFDSIDGEGKRTGLMATFVRFAGCNLRCSYCDTAYPWKRVTLTGGEPLLQPLASLCGTLGREGFECNIETNGAVPMMATRPEGLFYTMDWKCPDSGMEGRMCADNFPRLESQDVVKFVVGSGRDLCAMERVVRRWFMTPGAPRLYVSPVFGRIEPRRLVEFVRDHALAEVTVQVQLHKVIWPPDMRGV